MITQFKIFESENNITVPDVAWLYFLHYVYHGKLKIESWATDNRMNGVSCQDALSKFDCVKIENNNYIFYSIKIMEFLMYISSFHIFDSFYIIYRIYYKNLINY